MIRMTVLSAVALSLALAAPMAARATPQGPVLDHYAAQAKQDDAGFRGFSAARGETLFRTEHGGGQPETPACTACHGSAPETAGRTRAGKPIEPMALSRNPVRYTELEKAEKWFGRNCRSVLGRECTAVEKGDFITFMATR